MLFVDALGAGGEDRTRNREIVSSTWGVPVAELSIVPPLYVSRTISAQRKVRPLPTAQRRAALHKTAEIFANSVIAGLDFDHYGQLASRCRGCRSARPGPRLVAWPTRSKSHSMRCGTHAPPALSSTGVRSAPAGDVRSGGVAVRCSRCTHPETPRVFMVCGRRR